MRLPAWRETFMWLAVSACGGAPGWMTTSPKHKVSVLEVPLIANASVVAHVEDDDIGRRGQRVGALKGTLRCERLMSLLETGYAMDDSNVIDAQRTCDLDVAQALRSPAGFLFIVDAQGKRWMTAAQVIAAIAPIDTPEKASLAAWVSGNDLGWSDGNRGYGGLEDSMVRAVAGGYEVMASSSKSESDCGGSKARETVTNFRATVFVSTSGAVSVREVRKSHSYDVSDPCHPHGRRPADFVAVPGDGSVPGLLRRLMHDEAESVRAFERIARELRFHGAPEELIIAATRAADDERHHAERCAALLGEPAVIASDALPVRGLLELAIDNAREGCVGESYAALAAVVQARTAETEALRAHFAAIATDELAHAALAHAIADWIDGELATDARALVTAARTEAARELDDSFAAPASPAMRALGMPAGDEARRLLAAIAGDHCPRD